MQNISNPSVAIIGAGPYGLSVAAHLDSIGIDYRVFGKPMYRWRQQMPQGMFLKSDGRASNLSDPHRVYTLKRYCEQQSLPYSDGGLPVSLETFNAYASWFERNLVPNVEQVMVTALENIQDSFILRLSNGTSLTATSVVVATGLDNAAHIPAELASLPPELMSHAHEHDDLSRFAGREVIVVGAGQSALETAALLFEEGASVRVAVRRPHVVWNQPPRKIEKTLFQRLRYPSSHLGDGLELWLSSEAPELWRRLPQRFRLKRFRKVLGPAGAWWLKERFVNLVPVLCGQTVTSSRVHGRRVAVQLAGADGANREYLADHVIAATGYRFDVRRLPFLSAHLQSDLVTAEQQPVLAASFQSSVRGLYFTGLATASSFGPAMRFLHGSDYTARRIAQHVMTNGRSRRFSTVLELAGAAT